MSQKTINRKKMIKGIPVGKRWGDPGVTFVRRPEKDRYILVAVRRLNEIHNEDPQVMLCGCDLEGQSHGHAEQTYGPDELDELVADYEQAREDAGRNRQPRFAELERVG